MVILAGLVLCAPYLYTLTTRHSRAEAHLYQGAERMKQGQQAQAEQEWLAAKQLTPDNPNVYRALGELYRAQGRIPQARVVYNRLADLVPKEPHVLCAFAEEEVRRSTQNTYEDAVKDALRAAALEPNCVRALTVAGDVSMDKGDQKRGLDYLRRAVRLKPEDVPLTLHYINRMLEANDPAGVLAAARDLTQRYPGYSQGYALMATVSDLYPHDSPEARSTEGLLLKALRLDPTNALAHAKLGYVYLRAGNIKRAVPHLEAARLLRFDQTSLLFNLSEAYRKSGRSADAARVEREFQQISRLENEISTLERQASMAPADTALQKRILDVRLALDRAKQASREPSLPERNFKKALPPGMNGGETH